MEKQHMKIIIFSLILFIQDVTSINPFSEWSRQRAKHYNLEVEGNNRQQNLISSVKFLGNGGFLSNGLSSIKRLITTRPTLKQYIIQRRTENYYSTVKPHYENPHVSSSSPCKQGSTDCILKHLRNRGLIRNSHKFQYRRPKALETVPSIHPTEKEAEDPINIDSQDSLPVYRGKGHYRPDCWSSDGENDQAPPIDYAQYSDHESSESADVESAQLKKTVTRGRRNAEREPDPCLWQDY